MSDASPVLLTPDVVGGLAGKRVLVVGDIMLDAYLIGDADRISPEAPVPVAGSDHFIVLYGLAHQAAKPLHCTKITHDRLTLSTRLTTSLMDASLVSAET